MNILNFDRAEKLFKVLSLLIAMFSYNNTYSQKGVEDGSKYGHGLDSIDCIKNLSLSREYARQADYEAAYPYWQVAFNDCPGASKNIYIDGVKMVRNKLDNIKDGDSKKILTDSLMLIYERRIKYFGEKNEVRGRQGADLLRYSDVDNRENILKAYSYLKESIQQSNNEVSETVLASFISASLILYKNYILKPDCVIKDYIEVSEIMDSLIIANPLPELQNLKNNIDDNFAKNGPSDCDTLTQFFCDELKVRNEDISYLRTLTNLLRNKNCTKTIMFYDCSRQLHSLAPTSESAQNLAILAYNIEKYQEAADYYKQAAELESNDAKKAEYYYNLAIISNKIGNKPESRDYAYKASNLRKDWGEPYLLIGQIYAESKDICESISLPDAVFWIAVDMFNKAKSVDPTIEDKANNLIQTYSKYYPDTEEAFFMNITEGNTYNIGCWINETTKARFNHK